MSFSCGCCFIGYFNPFKINLRTIQNNKGIWLNFWLQEKWHKRKVLNLSGSNRDHIGTRVIFEQKQKGLRYTVTSHRLILWELKGSSNKMFTWSSSPFLSRQNRDNWNKSSWNKVLFQYFSLSFLKKQKELVDNYISKFTWTTNCGLNTMQA